MNANDEFDALLADALAPPSRAPDLDFVTRVDLAMDEELRYRRWRRSAVDRVASEALMLIGLIGAAAGIGRALVAMSLVPAGPIVVVASGAVVLGCWLALSGEVRRAGLLG